MKRDAPQSVRPYIDFNAVEEKHAKIHARLENWGLWAKARAPGIDGDSSPMFRLYRADNFDRSYGTPTALHIDGMDAQRIFKGVAALPDPHRIGLNWFYVRPVSPSRACRLLATTMAGLALFVRDGRQMLVNRGI